MDVSYKVGEWKWEEWPVVNYQKGTNSLTIKCGDKIEPIEVKVIEDTIRDLDILKSGLHLNLDSKGRSNRENKTSRSNWSYTNLSNETTKVVFNNFNWYNNGWILDENKNSCLRISNGASISIPLSVLNVENLTHGLTFEF
jgi:hypothetical protein